MNRRIPLNATDVQVHGTYVYDLGHDRLKHLGKISNEQAAELLAVPDELRSHEYMWLNKGWLVEGLPYLVRRFNEAPLVVGDLAKLPADNWRGPDLKVGDRIVYLADGNYYRLEVIK